MNKQDQPTNRTHRSGQQCGGDQRGAGVKGGGDLIYGDGKRLDFGWYIIFLTGLLFLCRLQW